MPSFKQFLLLAAAAAVFVVAELPVSADLEARSEQAIVIKRDSFDSATLETRGEKKSHKKSNKKSSHKKEKHYRQPKNCGANAHDQKGVCHCDAANDYYTSSNMTCTPCPSGASVNSSGDACICPPCGQGMPADLCLNAVFIPATNSCGGEPSTSSNNNPQSNNGGKKSSKKSKHDKRSGGSKPKPYKSNKNSSPKKSSKKHEKKKSAKKPKHHESHRPYKNCGTEAKADKKGVCHCNTPNDYYKNTTMTCAPCPNGTPVNKGGDSCVCPPCTHNDSIDLCLALSLLPSTQPCGGNPSTA